MKDINKAERAKRLKLIASTVIYTAAIYLCVIWFGWKLLIVLFLWQWAANLNISVN